MVISMSSSKHVFKYSATAALVLLFSFGCSEQLSHEELLVRAQTAFDEGKMKAALVDTKTALQKNSASAAGRKLLGDIFLNQRNLTEAGYEYRKALDISQDAEVGALYAYTLVDSAQQEQLLELDRDGYFEFVAQSPRYLASLARAQAETGDTFSAEHTIEMAVAAAPDDQQVRLSRAIVLARHTGELEEPRELLKKLVADKPDYADAWSAYGRLSQALGNLESAASAFKKAQEINRYRLEDRIILLAVLIDQENYTAAEEELELLAKVAPNHPGVNYAQARVQLSQGNTKVALEKLSQVLNVAPRHVPSVYLSANANYQAGNFEAAETQLLSMLDMQPGNIQARQMLASIYLQQDELEQANRLSSRLVRESSQDTVSLIVLAQTLSKQKLHDKSAEVFAQLVEREPTLTKYRAAMGSELVQAGKAEQAIKVLVEAKQVDPTSWPVRASLAVAYAANGNVERANEEVAEYAALSPDHPGPGALAGRIALVQGDRERAAAEFTRSLELDPSNAKTREGLATLAMLNDDSGAAIEILNAGLQENPNDLKTLVNLAAVYEKRGEYELMTKTLRKAMESNPEALEPSLILARYSLSQREFGEAVRLLTEARKTHNDARVHQLLIVSFVELGQSEAAVNSSESLLALHPKNLQALRLAAQAQRVNRNLPGAETHLRKLLDLYPDDILSRKMLVEVLIVRQKWDDAGDQLAALPEGTIPEAALTLARGRVELKAGNMAEAEKLLRKAYSESPSTGSLVLLSGALWEQGKGNEATGMMEFWLESEPDDIQVLAQLGAYYATQGRSADSVRAYEKLVTLVPNDPTILNNLAWAYRKVDFSAALNYVEQALKIAPTNAAILDTKAMILYDKKEYKKALLTNQKSLDIDSQPDYRFHRAQILVATGDKEGAVKLLQGLTEGKAFTEQINAKILLARLTKEN